MAFDTLEAPVTRSPPAKNRGRLVSSVKRLTSMVPLSLISRPEALAEVEIDGLAHGQNHRIALEALDLVGGIGLRRPERSYSPSRVFTTSSALTLPLASPMMRCGADRKTNLRAFLFGGRSLLFDRRHVLALAAIDHGDVRAQRSAVRAESMAALPPPITTTLRPSCIGSPLGDRFQERQRRIHALQLGARQVDPGFLPGADGQAHGVEALVQIVQRDVEADARVEDELHAQPLDQLQFARAAPAWADDTPAARSAACRRLRAANRRPSRRGRTAPDRTPPSGPPARRPRRRPCARSTPACAPEHAAPLLRSGRPAECSRR